MILRFSSSIPQSERDKLKYVINRAARSVEVDHRGLLVNVRRGQGGGRAYNWVWRTEEKASQCRMIGLRVPPPAGFPYISRRHGLTIEAANVYEWIAYIAGHEFGHILDYQKNRPTTEQRADWYGWTALQEYKEVTK